MAENLKTHFYDIFSAQRSHDKGFPGGSVVKNSTANEGTTGDSSSIPGLGRSPGGENGNPLQYSCLENPMEGGTWWLPFIGLLRAGRD